MTATPESLKETRHRKRLEWINSVIEAFIKGIKLFFQGSPIDRIDDTGLSSGGRWHPWPKVGKKDITTKK